jgi:predicted DCC family thiol-disulfide oxidoreductase YuxK
VRPTELTVLYDSTCALCVRCKDWLATQDAFVPMRFMACGSEEARATYGAVPWLGEELVVVSNHGDVWAGPAAFITSLWALRKWREWSYRISGPELVPLARRFFNVISSNRRTLAALVTRPTCEDGACRVPRAYR